MDRRSIIKRAGIASILAVGVAACGKKEVAAAAPAVVTGGAAVRWRLASSFPKSLDTLFGAEETFARLVSEMSGGKFTISVHAAGELIPAFGVVDGVQNGTVEMAHTAAYYFFGKDDAFALSCGIPFGLNSRQMSAWMYQGNGLKLTREFYANYNIMNFPGGNTGAQMGGWYRNEINSVEDMKGLKFRVGGFAGKVLERMGVVPQNMPGGEVYQALEKGTLDAAEWIGPYDDQKLGFNKVAPYYYYPAWWEGGPQLEFFINAKAFQALSSENKAIVETAAAFAHQEVQAKYDVKNPTALKQLVAAKAKVLPFSKDIMDRAFKESMGLYAELNESNPKWKKIYEDLAAFRKEQNQWFRFTEARFDNYMQSQIL